MTLETKLRLVLETYHGRMSMADSKALIDKQKIMERNDLSTKQLYSMLMEIRMEEIEREDSAQNIAIHDIIEIMKEEK